MAEYGIPYMGSKGTIADQVVIVFPKAENFYDLFGGGFSITHAMIKRRSKDFKTFYFNEIKSDIVDLIKDAICGKYNYDVFKPEWISKEDFVKRLNEPYIRICWSFGNNQKGYMFSTEIEPYKKSMHNAIVFNQFDDLAKKVIGSTGFKEGYSIQQRRLFLRNRIEYFRLNGIPDFLIKFLNDKQQKQLQSVTGSYQLQRLEQLQQLEQLERLQQLQQLERLEQLQQLRRLQQLPSVEFSSKSYDQVEIKPNSIVYCDPPYKGTADYGSKFDTSKFLNWAHEQTEPVFISEYKITDKRFKRIKSFAKRSMLSSQKDIRKVMSENIYINKAAQDKFLGS